MLNVSRALGDVMTFIYCIEICRLLKIKLKSPLLSWDNVRIPIDVPD